MKEKTSYKEEVIELKSKIKELEIKLNAKEQVISIFYNLFKDMVFWRRE